MNFEDNTNNHQNRCDNRRTFLKKAATAAVALASMDFISLAGINSTRLYATISLSKISRGIIQKLPMEM